MAVLGPRFCARAPSSCGKRGPLPIAVRGPLTTAASLVAEHRLQTLRPSSRGTRAQPLRGMRDPPRPGPEPVLSALAGRSSTTAPPGKPSNCILKRVTGQAGAQLPPRSDLRGWTPGTGAQDKCWVGGLRGDRALLKHSACAHAFPSLPGRQVGDSGVAHIFFFFFFAAPQGLWDLNSPTRDRTQALSTSALRVQSPNHWTGREFPSRVALTNGLGAKRPTWTAGPRLVRCELPHSFPASAALDVLG